MFRMKDPARAIARGRYPSSSTIVVAPSFWPGGSVSSDSPAVRSSNSIASVSVMPSTSGIECALIRLASGFRLVIKTWIEADEGR